MYGSSGSLTKKVTVPDLRARKALEERGEKITMVTAYDFTMARLVDEAGVDMVLVGDSLGMVVQGEPHTLGVTVEDVCYHGRAVARGATRAHLIGDMPFLSFQISAEDALRNAGAMIKHGCFEAVKLEGGVEVAEQVRRIVGAGIPVMGHVGLTPQSVHAMGGFRVQKIAQKKHAPNIMLRQQVVQPDQVLRCGAGRYRHAKRPKSSGLAKMDVGNHQKALRRPVQGPLG